MDMGGMSSASATSMAMSMASGMASSTASSMSMSMSTGMTNMMYLNSNYHNQSVIFKSLSANSPKIVFAIFVLLMFTSFVLRGLIFISLYLDKLTQHQYDDELEIETESDCDFDKIIAPPKHISITSQLFTFTKQDIIKILLSFVIAMLTYCLMLAAMTFVISYFMAICTGFALGEWVFNKLGKILKVGGGYVVH